VIPTAPLAARNRLAELILSALRDRTARDELSALASAIALPAGWRLEDTEDDHGAALIARARCAREALADLPLLPATAAIDDVLAAAAALFDHGLFFEVHEVLEPFWQRASGQARLALQGLIQIAVGYQHLANGNVMGARSLLVDGASRLESGRGALLETTGFVERVRETIDRLEAFDWSSVPRFPRAGDPKRSPVKEA
jgi:DUF309 family protein family protein